MADENHPTYLSPSELGTKDYWETYYARTLSHISNKRQPCTANANANSNSNSSLNPASNSDADSDADSDSDIDDDDDPGTSWFSEHNAPTKVLDFLTSETFPLAPGNTRRAAATTSPDTDSQPSILDLGTGNGSMLALLRKRGGFRGAMVGVDYSARSVELARELQRLRIHSAYLSESESEPEDEEHVEGTREKDGEEPIRFEEWDILNAEEGLAAGRVDWFPYGAGGFDIVLDKGTFDAVSLSDETVAVAEGETATVLASGKVVQRRVCERYPGIARKLVRKRGFLVVTSCNWTEEELIRWFTGEGSVGAEADRLVVWGRVEYPKFRFGGQEGQGVCTVCFQRVDASE